MNSPNLYHKKYMGAIQENMQVDNGFIGLKMFTLSFSDLSSLS